jgi:hypothetical protein
VYKLAEDRVVRFTDFSPQYQPNEFFFKVMVMHTPFHTEDYLVATDGSYYNECVRRGVIRNTKDLETVLDDYCVYHMHEESRFDVLCNGLLNSIGLEHLQMDIAMACTCSPASRSVCDCQEAIIPLPFAQAKDGIGSVSTANGLDLEMLPSAVRGMCRILWKMLLHRILAC